MSILKIKDKNGNFIPIYAIKGDPGENYILTEEDKEEIANKVTIPAPEVNIPEWAQQETKPQYTAEEVGAAYSIVELSRKPKSAPEQELELKGKVGQFGIYKEGNRVDFYRCLSVTEHSQYGNTFIYEWEYLGTNSNCEHIPYNPNLNYPGGAKLNGNMVYSDSSSGKALYIRVSENKPLVKISLATDIVISVDENSTDDQMPSAKLFYDTIGNIETTLDTIIEMQNNLIGGATE